MSTDRFFSQVCRQPACLAWLHVCPWYFVPSFQYSSGLVVVCWLFLVHSDLRRILGLIIFCIILYCSVLQKFVSLSALCYPSFTFIFLMAFISCFSSCVFSTFESCPHLTVFSTAFVSLMTCFHVHHSHIFLNLLLLTHYFIPLWCLISLSTKPLF